PEAAEIFSFGCGSWFGMDFPMVLRSIVFHRGTDCLDMGKEIKEDVRRVYVCSRIGSDRWGIHYGSIPDFLGKWSGNNPKNAEGISGRLKSFSVHRRTDPMCLRYYLLKKI